MIKLETVSSNIQITSRLLQLDIKMVLQGRIPCNRLTMAMRALLNYVCGAVCRESMGEYMEESRSEYVSVNKSKREGLGLGDKIMDKEIVHV